MNGAIASFTADAAYDTTAIYEAAAARGAKVIVPPRKTATKSKRPSARDRTVRRLIAVGRRQWKKESGYHRQVLPLHGRIVQSDEVHRQAQVENTFFRYKTIIGPGLRARHPES